MSKANLASNTQLKMQGEKMLLGFSCFVAQRWLFGLRAFQEVLQLIVTHK